MTNNVLVLGAGSLQVPLIQTVKSKGYYAIVVSLYEDEPGMQIADEKVIADFCDEDIILDYALKYDICGILTDQTDIPVRTVAYVAEKMNLPGIGYETACIFTNKFLMREKCQELGIPTIRFRLVDKIGDAILFYEEIGRDVILKPINNQGSKGVYRISSLDDLYAKYHEAERYSRGEPILAEEYIAGEEIVIEALTYNGVTEGLICGDTYYFNIPDTFSAKQRLFPSCKNRLLIDKALSLNKTIVEGFGLKNGITHGEYIISKEQIYLIEIAARGGGVYISSDIIPLMTGFDTNSFIVNMAVDGKISSPEIRKIDKTVCYIAFFLPAGRIIRIDGREEVSAMPFVRRNNLDMLYVGKKTGENIDKTSRFFFVVEAESDYKMKSYIRSIREKLKIEVETALGVKGIIWD